LTVNGFSLLSQVSTTYTGFLFVTLEDWGARKSRQTQYQEIVQHVNQELRKLPDGLALSFPPPAILGVGTSGGFTFILEDRAGRDPQYLGDNVQKFIAAASKRPEIAPGLVSTYLPSVPQQYLEVDREKVLKQGVPLSALAHFETRYGPEFTMRYNLYRSAQIIGSAAPGYSSAQAMKALEETFKQTMPREMGYDYMGMSFQEKKAQEGIPAAVIFGFSLLFVFLILAALYESWTLPFSVLLSTPVAVFGAFAVLWLRRWLMGLFLPAYMVQIESDVYAEIGLVMLIGLAAKNAILIVEFAKDKYESGMGLTEAALEGARIRLRPILMTSFAFILGCVPLWTASGAGALGRQIMGTTVIGGMLAASAVGIFLIPAIFYLVEKLSGARVPDIGLAHSPAQGD
jgi:HAE1 family hydrophobic/amphiphilic exporter-1